MASIPLLDQGLSDHTSMFSLLTERDDQGRNQGRMRQLPGESFAATPAMRGSHGSSARGQQASSFIELLSSTGFKPGSNDANAAMDRTQAMAPPQQEGLQFMREAVSLSLRSPKA